MDDLYIFQSRGGNTLNHTLGCLTQLQVTGSALPSL